MSEWSGGQLQPAHADQVGEDDIGQQSWRNRRAPALRSCFSSSGYQRVGVQVVHHVHHGELVLSGGAGHHLVLGTFRVSISGHKADGKRWCMP